MHILFGAIIIFIVENEEKQSVLEVWLQYFAQSAHNHVVQLIIVT